MVLRGRVNIIPSLYGTRIQGLGLNVYSVRLLGEFQIDVECSASDEGKGVKQLRFPKNRRRLSAAIRLDG